MAVYFEEETLVAEEDHAASPEVVDVAPVHGVQYEVSAFQDTIHATPIREEEQREVSAAREIVPTTLTQEAHRGISTPQKVEETTHAASVSFQTALSDDPEALSIDTAQTSDGTPRFCDEMSASPEEMNDTVEQKENAPESNPTNDTKMNGQDEPTASAITARETEKIEKWISQTDLADTDTDADAANALLKGDDADDERSGEIENGAAIATWSGIDGGARSETRSVSPDSDFQTALRLYMVKGTRVGGRAQRRSGVNQRRTRREMFKLGKTGGERSARSA